MRTAAEIEQARGVNQAPDLRHTWSDYRRRVEDTRSDGMVVNRRRLLALLDMRDELIERDTTT